MAYLDIDARDVPTEEAGIAFTRELATKLKLEVLLGGIPLEAEIIKDPAFAMAVKAVLRNGGISLYIALLTMLDPLADLISLCA